tara:strand:+ start:1368 stop:1598 length:231 start_codon:yes stop_codon:yes gene_type:complete
MSPRPSDLLDSIIRKINKIRNNRNPARPVEINRLDIKAKNIIILVTKTLSLKMSAGINSCRNTRYTPTAKIGEYIT